MIEFYELNIINDELLEFAVIYSMYKNEWVFVKHKDRTTWEMPGGHREFGENINTTATRELFEETGSKEYSIEPVCAYSVKKDGVNKYGQLFYAEIIEKGELPKFEIGELKCVLELPMNLTYPEIQPDLHNRILQYKQEGINKLNMN